MSTSLQWNFPHLALVFLAAALVPNPAVIASAQREETKSAELYPGKSISHSTAAEIEIQPMSLPNLLLEPPAIPGVKEAIARPDAIGMSIIARDLLPNWGKGQHEAAQRASTDTKLKLVQADTNNQPSPSFDTAPSTDSAPAPTAPAATEAFTDIAADYWAYPFIQVLATRNAIVGFPDSSFRPEQPVTRAELAAMLQKPFNPNPVRQLSPAGFSDVPTDYWAADAIKAAYEAGFIAGYPNNLFLPNQTVSKVQAITALANGLSLAPSGSAASIVNTYYTDAGKIPLYAVNQVAAATQANLIVNYPDVRTLNPQAPLTRAEAAAHLYQALVRLGQVQPLPANVAAASYIVGDPGAVSQAPPQKPNGRESATAQEDTSPESDRVQVSQPSDAVAGSDLREQSQSPIGNVISLPFQNNTNFGVGQFNRTQNILNIQPVIPTSLGNNWLLISRIIVPIVYQPQLARDVGDQFGLGDINPTFFFSPKSSGKLAWGVGPVFLLPTATDDTLGADKWGIGPSAVVVYTSGNIVTGALANNIWSFAGDDDRPDVNQLLLQPFFNYNLPKGWFLVSAPIITANWEAEAGEEWTVPIGGGFGRLFTIGKQPVSAALQGYYNIVRPEDSTEWTIRAAFTLLYPR